MEREYEPGCPMTYNIPPNETTDNTYDCIGSRCAWWVEEAQKCAVLVMAEAHRKAVRSK